MPARRATATSPDQLTLELPGDSPAAPERLAPVMTLRARRATVPRRNVMGRPGAGTVSPLRRSVPCATGWALGIPVEIHFDGTVGRAAVALHELHQLAEDGLGDVDGDALLAVAQAADELAERLHDEPGNADVAIAVGTALSHVGSASLSVTGKGDSALVIRRGAEHVAVGTACTKAAGGDDVATASSSSAAASVRVARSVLHARPGRLAHLRISGSVLLIRADGTVEPGPR